MGFEACSHSREKHFFSLHSCPNKPWSPSSLVQSGEDAGVWILWYSHCALSYSQYCCHATPWEWHLGAKTCRIWHLTWNVFNDLCFVVFHLVPFVGWFVERWSVNLTVYCSLVQTLGMCWALPPPFPYIIMEGARLWTIFTSIFFILAEFNNKQNCTQHVIFMLFCVLGWIKSANVPRRDGAGCEVSGASVQESWLD